MQKILQLVALSILFFVTIGTSSAFAQTSLIDSSPVPSTQVSKPLHGNSDQSFTGPFDLSGGGFATAQQMTGQTFTAGEENLVGVDLFLYEFDGLSETVTVTIRDGDLFGAFLGTTSMVVTLNPGTNFQNPQRVHFDFNPPVILDPGQTYGLQFEEPDGVPQLPEILAALGSGNPYSGGSAFQSSNEFPDFDFGFVTYFGPFGVKCTHTPVLWEPGDQITIVAESVDEMGNLRVVDSIAIFTHQGLASQNFGASTNSHTETFSNTDGFAYGCLVEKNDKEVYSGPKFVAPSPPLFPFRIIQHTSSQLLTDGIDIVFIPDVDSYTSFDDTDFLDDISIAIDVFLDEPTILRNQDNINFWLAEEFGLADGFVTIPVIDCLLDVPDSYRGIFTGFDAGIVLHSDPLRDCAFISSRIFSSEPDTRILVHELGHAPFGLADEYCCDGGYFVANPFPNLYDTQADCDNDPFNSGRTCHVFFRASDNEDWYTSDPAFNDIMVDGGDFQPLDLRRVNWVFDKCDNGEC